jgi:ketosteroid isomerase-like protein
MSTSSWARVARAAAVAGGILGCACAGEGEAARESAAQAVAAYQKALADKDVTAMAGYIASDFVLVGSDGKTSGREELLETFRDETLQIDPFTVEEKTWIETPDAALFAGRSDLTGRAKGAPFRFHHRFSDYWQLRGGSWQLVYAQETLVGAD